jgi:hypothetical protein
MKKSYLPCSPEPQKYTMKNINYINMERFISPNFKKEHKQKLKFVKKIYDSLISETAECFSELSKINSELEEIYARSVNLKAQQKFTAEFIKNL